MKSIQKVVFLLALLVAFTGVQAQDAKTKKEKKT